MGDEVVEVEVEEKVKEEVEGKVVEEKAADSGQWLRVFWGAKTAGVIMHLPWDPAVLAGPQPPTAATPSAFPRRVRFGLSVF